jgi:RNA polymerase-binding transcription factor DksA
MPQTSEHWAKVLRARLNELDHRLHMLDAELDSHQSADWAELAVEREGDEVLERLGQSGEIEARLIAAALDRLEAGTFGTCLRCGDPIADERLAVLPHAPLCSDCAGAAGGARRVV